MLITKEEIVKLNSEIENLEKVSSGEIRIVIRRHKPFLKKLKPIKEIAEKEFVNSKMQNTKNRNAVLLYICEIEKEFRIVADDGMNSVVPNNFWSQLSVKVSEKFKMEEYFNGINLLINEIKILMAKYFPIKENDVNELPNNIVIQ